MPLPSYLSIDELQARCALWRTSTIGPKNYHELIAFFGSAQMALQEAKSDAWPFNENLHLLLQKVNYQDTEQDLRWLEHPHHHILTEENSTYPALLAEIPYTPPLLFVKGNPICLHNKQIAVVGSRNPSFYGKHTTIALTTALVEQKLTITSGLALGIDAISHEACLAANGSTIAVLATGLDTIYPKRHAALADRILSHEGALVSEFGLNTPLQAYNFPRRNRIISGLSLGVLVIEANIQSGSLITAKHALAQNREIFAVPGSIKNPLSKGCHALIKQGAKLVENVNDIVEEFSFLSPISSKQDVGFQTKAISNDPTNRVLAAIEEYPQGIEDIALISNEPIESLYSILLALELAGKISLLTEGYVKRI